MSIAPGARVTPQVFRSLLKFGSDVEIARKKRHLTVEQLCSRAGISRPLYNRMVHGAPGTSASAIAMVLFALGRGTPFDDLLDMAKDDTGMLSDLERLPQRVRHKRKPRAGQAPLPRKAAGHEPPKLQKKRAAAAALSLMTRTTR